MQNRRTKFADVFPGKQNTVCITVRVQIDEISPSRIEG